MIDTALAAVRHAVAATAGSEPNAVLVSEDSSVKSAKLSSPSVHRWRRHHCSRGSSTTCWGHNPRPGVDWSKAWAGTMSRSDSQEPLFFWHGPKRYVSAQPVPYSDSPGKSVSLLLSAASEIRLQRVFGRGPWHEKLKEPFPSLQSLPISEGCASDQSLGLPARHSYWQRPSSLIPQQEYPPEG